MTEQEDRISGGGKPERVAPDRASERGRPATFDPQSGEVHGSGSGAGGGNPAEDYDDDPMAGGGGLGDELPGGARRADQGIERPTDPDEGI